jgi:D-alanine-D-alanine ligase-like ATP-grasp enzyme
VLYAARKHPPFMLGDGEHSIRDLLIAHNAALQARGLSPASMREDSETSLDRVLAKGERWSLPGRMNLSAGGTMSLETALPLAAATAARTAACALGLRVAAVDVFTNIAGVTDATAVIEVNSNPAIRVLEECERPDLILKLWHHTFSALGLLTRAGHARAPNA